METDCIPAGMELFPAADQDQFEFIKRVIDDCDYYLVIIGGRYGSTVTATGISYTEQEYDYAVERGLKVIALIHRSPDEIPFGKSEQDPALRQKLQQFRDKVANGRLVKFWKSVDELPGLVALGLVNAIKMFPAVGWIRADRAASEDVLGEINELRKQNLTLQDDVAKLSGEARIVIENLAGLDEEVTLWGTYKNRSGASTWKTSATWRNIFGYIAPYLETLPVDSTVESVLADALFRKSGSEGYAVTLNNQLLQTVAVQLQALGLIDRSYMQTTAGGMGLFWSLTPQGRRLMMEVRTVRTQTPGTK